ncbi:uncharacterized protein LOC142765917 [Rhipicephalus microplus]|uniref:uncharacterized protein LOC142765917 n=1 Tax=Rhipicephalus microplus TaxID=6941 RepID=UPI003F6C0524
MTFFDVLGDPLLNVVNTVIGKRVKPASFGAGRIVLILKDGAPSHDPSSWRPITLLNVDYKIVASILNSRLKIFLPDMIAPHQSCAVPGRSMYANLTLTRDVFKFASCKCIAGVFLSLDQAKAFDRGLHLTGLEELKILAFADDISLFLRDARSLARFRQVFSAYAAASGATLNEAKSKALLFGPFPTEVIEPIEAVSTVKVLGVLFTCERVAASTWSRVLSRAQLLIERAKLHELTLRDKAIAVKTSARALASHVSRIAIMPSRIASALNKGITAFMWEGKPPPVRRHLLQLSTSDGGLGLPHDLTTGKILALKTARTLAKASVYAGRNLLLYWASVRNSWLDAGSYRGPFAVSPSPFYRAAAATMRMLTREVPGCEIDSDPPARLIETLTANQLHDEDRRRAKRAKREIAALDRYAFRGVQDFIWKRAWDVLHTRQRQHPLGIVPDARCPNCQQTKTLNHALFDCVAARPVWRMTAHSFSIRPPPYHRRNKGPFAKLVFTITLFVIWQRRSLAEAKKKSVRAASDVGSRQADVDPRVSLQRKFSSLPGSCRSSLQSLASCPGPSCLVTPASCLAMHGPGPRLLPRLFPSRRLPLCYQISDPAPAEPVY